MNKKESKIIIKKKGIVVSKKDNKTIVVAVNVFKTHPKYKKKFLSTKKYKAHDENGKCQVGEIVEIIPCRPISRDKKYKIAI
jgi:small subunit ribosomal protein S17